MSFNLENKNPVAFYKMMWCPDTERVHDRTRQIPVNIELIGSLTNNTGQPIKNGRIGISGTRVKTLEQHDYEIGQEVYFFNKWWSIIDIEIDLTELAPQAGSMKNVSYYLTIRAANPYQESRIYTEE